MRLSLGHFSGPDLFHMKILIFHERLHVVDMYKYVKYTISELLAQYEFKRNDTKLL